MLIAATVVAASVYVNAEGLNFEVCHGNYSGTDLPYRKAVCNSNSDGDGKFALVIYLHGGSSKGNDNAKQMDEKGIDSIANFIVRHHRKAVFVVPQCPADKSWGGQMLNVLKGLVDEQTQDSEMDRNRIYISAVRWAAPAHGVCCQIIRGCLLPRCLWREIPANASLTMLQKHRFSPLWALPTGL